jgi:protein-S-isoprenylcysteine O-methyltransferase Ste14
MTAPATPSVHGAPRADREERGDPRTLVWRRLACYAFAAAALVFARPAESVLWPWSLPSGVALAALGEALRVWGCGHLDKNQRVVSSGPYAYLRHPLYLGTLLILVGACVAAGNAVVLYGLLPLGLVVFFAYYAPKKERVESDRLRRRFGAQFEEYKASVPGFAPRLTRWSGASDERWKASLVVENSEVSTVVIVGVGLVLLVLRAFV